MTLFKPVWAAWLLATLSTGAFAAPIDLNTWSQQGDSENGRWNVSADGSSVLQTINGDPTFFVSDTNYLNTQFDGSFRVNTNSDNDFIGFVFGYQAPLGAGADTQTFDMFLFDWKQGNQGTASEGFTLSYINGAVTADDNTAGAFWGKDAATTGDSDINVIGTDFGVDRGWASNTSYDFNLLYQTDRIQIRIDGGDFLDETIFDVTPGDVAGLSSFADGRFGFYNLSQANVSYQGFTQVLAPPIDPCAGTFTDDGCSVPPVLPPVAGVPEPGPLGLVLFSGALALVSLRKKQKAH